MLSASKTPTTFVWSPDAFPKLMFPFAKIFPDAVMSPDAVILPSTLRPSFTLTTVESLELKDVPSILNELATTPPVPDPESTRSAFEEFAVMLFPEIVTCCPKADVPYNYVKFSFILLNAVLNGSPVPSFELEPMFIVCCAIL